MQNELEVDSVICSFGSRKILSDIYLKCTTGDITGIFGLNGSGKSTLFKIIFGTIKASASNIRINGIHKENWYKSYGAISYLPQDHFLQENIKVGRLIDIFCGSKNGAKLKNDERIRYSIHKKCTALSGGEKRYLEISILLAINSMFYIFDEPFSEIDPVYCGIIEEKIKDAGSRAGIIISDHNYDNVMRISTKTMLLQNGKLSPLSGNSLSGSGYTPNNILNSH